MARIVIQDSSTGEVKQINDVALPFFPGWVQVDTIDDEFPPTLFYTGAAADARYVNVAEISDPDSPGGVALRAASVVSVVGGLADMSSVVAAAVRRFRYRQTRPGSLTGTGTFVNADSATPSQNGRPCWLSADGKRLFSYGVPELKDSTDEGANWRTLHTFPKGVSGVRELPNGELLVGTYLDDVDATPGAMWVSSGYNSGVGGASATWTKTLTMDLTANARTEYSFSTPLHHHDDLPAGVNMGMMVIGEYGNKADPNSSRKVYLTEDYGLTWRVIYDPVVGTNYHHHGAQPDPWSDTIWLTTGDGTPNRKVLWSSDWRNATPTWNQVTTPTEQGVGIWPMPDCILIGNDEVPNGVYRIARLSGSKTDFGPLRTVHLLTRASTLQYLCRGFYKRPGGPLLIAYSATRNSGATVGLIVTTPDGSNFTTVWTEPVPYTDTTYPRGDYGVYTAVGPTVSGKVLAHMRRDSGGFLEHRVTFPELRYLDSLAPVTTYPKHVQVSPFDVPVATSLWNANNIIIGGANGASIQASSQNATVEYDVNLGPGLWSIGIPYETASSFGIMSVYLDGALVGTVDQYLTTVTHKKSTLTGFLVDKGGLKRLKIALETKNASSSGFGGAFHGAYLTNTDPPAA